MKAQFLAVTVALGALMSAHEEPPQSAPIRVEVTGGELVVRGTDAYQVMFARPEELRAEDWRPQGPWQGPQGVDLPSGRDHIIVGKYQKNGDEFYFVTPLDVEGERLVPSGPDIRPLIMKMTSQPAIGGLAGFEFEDEPGNEGKDMVLAADVDWTVSREFYDVRQVWVWLLQEETVATLAAHPSPSSVYRSQAFVSATLPSILLNTEDPMCIATRTWIGNAILKEDTQYVWFFAITKYWDDSVQAMMYYSHLSDADPNTDGYQAYPAPAMPTYFEYHQEPASQGTNPPK